MKEIAVTGLGMCTPLGDGTAANWNELTQPSSSLAPFEEGQKRGFARAQELAAQAAQEAFESAGLYDGKSLSNTDPERVACTFSASKPLFNEDETLVAPDVINYQVRQRFSLGGEARNIIAACATGAASIALAASWIDQGLCDVALAGSVEPALHPLMAAGFRRMGVVTPDSAMRPFDRDRDGFLFGEGAGAIVLESAAHARSRGAKAIARLSGWALGADAHSAVAFNSNGQRIADVIGHSLNRAGLEPAQIRHINAHGTATHLNDWIETQALLKAFGAQAQNLMISATKASTGHLLGAAGSIEFIFTVLALRNQFIPPTLTLENPDPECALDYTPGQGHAAVFEHALSLSFGFGGPIGALVASTC